MGRGGRRLLRGMGWGGWIWLVGDDGCGEEGEEGGRGKRER